MTWGAARRWPCLHPSIVAIVGDATQVAPDPDVPATLSLVIPAYNEEQRLPALLEALAAEAEGAVAAAGMELVEALIVDDGSGDHTGAILREAAERDERIVPVRAYERNRGKGAAFAAGVERARGEYVLLADVDLSTPLSELPKLTAAVRQGADIAIGSRAVPGAVVERGPRHRKLLGAAFNGTVRMLTGLRLRDTQNGFKLFPAKTTRRLLAEQTCPGFAFDVELLMRADQAGLEIAEVPILYLHDERSSVRVASASMEMLRDVSGLAYRLRLRRSARPRRRSRRAAGLTEIPADDSD
jgi:dolichyl-phosphate beta-glucosyltransferase